VKSCDPFWLACGRLITSLLWFHPLMWRVTSAHSAACEEVCDGVAAAYLGSAEAYSKVLAREALALHTAHPAPGGVPMVRTAEIVHRLRTIRRGICVASLGGCRLTGSIVLASTLLLMLSTVRFVNAESEQPGNPNPALDLPHAATAPHAPSFSAAQAPAGRPAPIPDTSDKSEQLKSLVLEYPGGPDFGLEPLERLNAIKHLVLTDHDLEQAAIGRIASLVSLESLRLSIGRPLTRQDLDTLSHLGKLRELQLTWAGLESDAYAELPRFSSVERLVLGGTGHGPEALRHLAAMASLVELRILDLSDSELAALPILPGLQTLDITGDGYQYTAAGFATLSHQPQLKTLVIRGRFQDDAIQAFEPASTLKHLELHPNFQDRDWLTDATLIHLSTLTSLEKLVLFTGDFTDVGFRHLARLPSLTLLHIPNSRGFTDAIFDTLLTMPSIHTFKCRGENITDDGLLRLAASSTLKRVEFRFNEGKISIRAVEQLQAVLPDLTVVIGNAEV
jgi:hypothetical protein